MQPKITANGKNDDQIMSICSRIPEKHSAILHIITEAVQRSRQETQNDVKCFLVGGYVRDLLAGMQPKDIDCVCSFIDPFMVSLEKILSEKNIHHDKSVYAAFGTILMHFLDEDVEFVMPRKESYRSYQSRNPTVEEGTFEDDAFRRDFTVNSIYLSLNPENFCQPIDITGRGIADLRNKILDTPINPDITFSDDPLRMLRAARFVSVKGFKPAKRVIESSRKNAGRINIIVKDRIQEEIKKSIVSEKYFRVLDDLGLLDVIFPEVTPLRGMSQPSKYHAFDTFTHVMKVVECLPPKLRIAGLYHDVGKIIVKETGNFNGHPEISERLFRERFEELRFSRDFIHENAFIIRHHMIVLDLAYNQDLTGRAVRRFIADYRPRLDDLFTFARCDKIAAGVDVDDGLLKIKNLENRVIDMIKGVPEKKQLALSGKDVMETLKIHPGPSVGKIKDDVQHLVEEGVLQNDRDVLIDYIVKTYGSKIGDDMKKEILDIIKKINVDGDFNKYKNCLLGIIKKDKDLTRNYLYILEKKGEPEALKFLIDTLGKHAEKCDIYK